MKRRDITGIQKILDKIFDIKEPPVARCRLLSSGLETYHRIYTDRDVTADKTCIACGNCVDSCAVLRREPERLEKTEQRTSMAIESVVADDCEQCYSCALACPMTVPEIKEYIVNNRIKETLPRVKVLSQWDKYYAPIVAFICGVLVGLFLQW